jgi:hypothetical protein
MIKLDFTPDLVNNITWSQILAEALKNIPDELMSDYTYHNVGPGSGGLLYSMAQSKLSLLTDKLTPAEDEKLRSQWPADDSFKFDSAGNAKILEELACSSKIGPYTAHNILRMVDIYYSSRGAEVRSLLNRLEDSQTCAGRQGLDDDDLAMLAKLRAQLSQDNAKKESEPGVGHCPLLSRCGSNIAD